MKLCAVSVDLDEIPCYHAIHGLPMPADDSAHAVYALAADRLAALFTDLGIPATFFAIGADLAHAPAAAALRSLAAAGHEIGNHTQHHRYDLVRLDAATMRAEVRDASDAIEGAVGLRPAGFRAPGYTITDALFAVLRDEGFRYDSSVFPCPAYWSAKAAAIGLIAASGRRSRSILDTPNVLRAPADPYRPGQPYWTRGEAGIVELPIGVTRGPRLPFFGTSVTVLGARGAALLARSIAGRPLVNLELHGIDVLEAGDGLRALAGFQRDLQVPLRRKLESLASAVRTLRDRGYAFATLRDAAAQFDRRARPEL